MRYVSFDHFFTTRGNKHRVQILQLLHKEGDKSVTQISQKLKIEQSAVSHCMKRLLLCHFVEVKPQGKERIYAINGDTVQPLFNLIEKHVQAYCVKSCNHWE